MGMFRNYADLPKDAMFIPVSFSDVIANGRDTIEIFICFPQSENLNGRITPHGKSINTPYPFFTGKRIQRLLYQNHCSGISRMARSTVSRTARVMRNASSSFESAGSGCIAG